MHRRRACHPTIEVVCLLVAALTITVAQAQSLPGSIDPGRIPQQFQAPPETAPGPPADLSPAAPETQAPAGAERIKFTLRRLVIEGASAYGPEQLQPIYNDLIGNTVSVADLYRVADAITTRYRTDGFILSRAIIAAQLIKDGEAHIQVIEGFIDRVSFQGVPDPAMRSYADGLLVARPLTSRDLERCLLLMNDLPGVSVRGVLSPADGVQGGAELTLMIERKPVNAVVSIDNRGTKYLGPFELVSQAALNNPLGFADQFAVHYISTPSHEQELRFFGLGYAIPVGGDGTKLSFSVSASDGRPGSLLQSGYLETKTSGRALTVRLDHPVIRSRAENLNTDLAVTLSNSAADQIGLPSGERLVSSYEDRIRALRGGIGYDVTDQWGGSDFFRLELSQGLPILGASRDGALTGLSRPGGRSAFTKGGLDASRLQPLDIFGPEWSLLTALSAGWSFGQSLLATEQFGVGGAQFGRGYDPSELTGDYGAAGKLELQYDVPPKILAVTGDLGLKKVQAFSFVDYGIVTDQTPKLLDESARPRSLTSVGVGLRCMWTDYLSGSLEMDKPLTRPLAANLGKSDRDPYRFYFTVIVRY